MDNVVLPEYFTNASSGGVEYNTSIITAASGAEQRNSNWGPTGRGSWTLDFSVLKQSQLAELIAFFRARRGRLRAFKFKDPTDFSATAEPQTVYDTNKIQLKKTYTSGGVSVARTIKYPKTGTLAVYRNGDFAGDKIGSVDYETGIITLTGGTYTGTWTATFDFYIGVRFDTDSMDISAAGAGRSWPGVPIVEVIS
jgi:uncharacterized protein (TIGR02217 family)